MQLFFSQVLNGVGNGVVYASVALALVLIYRTTGILNFAQGEMALFSTYVAWKLTDAGLPVIGALALAMAFSFVAGALIERILIRPVEGHGAGGALNVVIVTLGMFLGINAVVQLIFGVRTHEMPSPFPSGSFELLAEDNQRLDVGYDTLGLVAVLLAECVLLWALLQKTRLGLRIRAVASNPVSSRLVGIDTGRVLMLGWGLAAALGALAGALVASRQTGFDASLMQVILVYAFAAAALGGFDSLIGAVVAGLIIGVADALTIQYVDALDGIELVVPLGLILVVLLVRPTGLFGRRTVERV